MRPQKSRSRILKTVDILLAPNRKSNFVIEIPHVKNAKNKQQKQQMDVDESENEDEDEDQEE